MTSQKKPTIPHHQHSAHRAVTEAVLHFRQTLGGFISRRVGDPTEAEDILQDVFYELVEVYQFGETVEQVSAWLYQVARFRIIDRFRKKKELSLHVQVDEADASEADEDYRLDLMLPSPYEGPDAALARKLLLKELQLAIDDLPESQREVFIAHELEGQSFKEMALQTGIAINTLLARKRYAVLALRQRLQVIYEELDN
ncbi:RNA polymerase sigma factor [Undibacterium sp. RuRC25W]|uniref:RNA polymerase sigma factor n=1 Tax=Undibacterium sp. RuRC25W TaxID=3413047 RepID=UPI003BF0585B